MIPLKLIENFCEQNPEFKLIRTSSFMSLKGEYYNCYYLTYKYPQIVIEMNKASIGYYLGNEYHSHIISSLTSRPFGDPMNLTATEVVDAMKVTVSFDDALEDEKYMCVDTPDEFMKAVNLFKKNMSEFVMQLKKMNIKSASREYEV